MKGRIVDKVLYELNTIAKVKMQIIINKELFAEKTIDFDTYRSVEDKLIEKLSKLEEVYAY